LKRTAISARYPENSDTMPFFDRLVAETRESQARFAMVPQLQAGLTGRVSRADYIAYLSQAYHHVRHTVPLMQEARSRLAARPMLVEALDEYIAEETGHEFWILDDIDAAAGNGAAVAASEPASATTAMVDHAYRTIREGNPAAFFGMVYVLEGTSIAMASHGAEAVRMQLGLPREAFRYLTSHGSLDQEHMKFFEALMNRIDDPGDQAAIIAMANDIFWLFGGMFAAFELEGLRAAA
jgi:pyrroloquinoline quinone (PQQ) biosynthesis protein C